MPSSPPLHPSGLQVWPDNIDLDFFKWVCEDSTTQHRKLLTSQNRLEYQAYLTNRNKVFETKNDIDRRRLATVKWTSIRFFELQDN